MMQLLLDSHIFIWAYSPDSKLPPHLKDLIFAPENQIWLNIATPWELQIKEQIGRLQLPTYSVEAFTSWQLRTRNIKVLDINTQHIWTLKQLPMHHRDPFDRIMIAQAIAENLTVVSVDRVFSQYPVALLS